MGVSLRRPDRFHRANRADMLFVQTRATDV